MEPNILNFNYTCSITQWTWELLISNAPENPIVTIDESAEILSTPGYEPVAIPAVSPGEIAVVTVATGTEFRLILEYNQTIRKYAEKIGATYIPITDTTQRWWGYEKFRVHDYARQFKYTIFVDADAVIADDCPNLVELLGDNDVLMYDDFSLLHGTNWLYPEKKKVYDSQQLPDDTTLPALCLNSGVVVCRQESADIWKPPAHPLPQSHCAEQIWVEHQALQYKIGYLPREYNNQWWMPNFEEFECVIKHYSSAPNRLSLFEEMMSIPVCSFREEDNQCNIITELSGDPYYPSPEECRGCSRCPKPFTVNEVTLSIANALRVEEGKTELSSPGKGPGTRLASLLSWFKKDSSCGCEERADIMDAWGVDGCKENMPTILHWLRDSAASQSLPYSETGMKIILHSIFFVEQKLCTNQSSKQS
jgi:hypothetical protein